MHAPLTPTYRTEWRPLRDLGPLAEAWRALAGRALEQNVFYEPAFALAAAPVFGVDAGAVLVWSVHGRLVGLFPARLARWRAGLRPALAGWTHPFAPLGTPLVDREQAEPVLAAWLDHLRADLAMPPLLLLPLLPEQGPLATALDAVLARRGLRSAAFGRHQRAALEPGADRADYLEQALKPRKRKELRRQRRRLEDIAPVTFAAADAPAEIAAALKDFLAIEASGWKGMAQTAVVNDDAVRGFVETAVAALAAEGKVRIDRMMLNGRAIAAAITLGHGATRWFWKIAYSEGLTRASPGVQLALDVTERLLDMPDVIHADSCATADHPMIDHLWRERLALGDRLIAVKPSRYPFALVCGVEALRRGGLDRAKAVRDRLRSRLRAKQPADHLAGGGHRHLADEGDLARILMGRQPGAHESLDLGGERV
jgi:CelD/BcsL family acetyltransferase involved in cellulose biosynthesis